jgi:hypothetical protein
VLDDGQHHFNGNGGRQVVGEVSCRSKIIAIAVLRQYRYAGYRKVVLVHIENRLNKLKRKFMPKK